MTTFSFFNLNNKARGYVHMLMLLRNYADPLCPIMLVELCKGVIIAELKCLYITHLRKKMTIFTKIILGQVSTKILVKEIIDAMSIV